VADRASAFADDEVARLLRERFVPVADNCSPLQRQQDAEGDFFRLLAEQGHYAGRTQPTDTRQGMYVAAADGRVYGACNVNRPEPLRQMLLAALARWEADGGSVVPEELGSLAPRGRHHLPPPAGGVVLRVWSRDLPRDPALDTRPDDWRRRAHNLDHAWFTAEEARQMVPGGGRAAPGQVHRWPAPLARRLARVHLVDNVRGETPPWAAQEVERAEVQVAAEGADGARVRLRLTGAVRAAAQRRWTDDFTREEYACAHGVDVALDGDLEWDADAGRFRRFDVAAAGLRWGGTKYNSRRGDFAPAPVGYWIELADGSLGSAEVGAVAESDRTPPWAIGWREYFDA
jgi:hypothetical protein